MNDTEQRRASDTIARAAARRFSLPAGMTYQNLSDLLAGELNEDFGGGNSYEMGGGRLWIRDFDDTSVVYEDRDGSLTRRAYTITPGNDVQWGQPEEVAAQTAYISVAGSEAHPMVSKDAMARTQQIHDHAVKLGATCPIPDMHTLLPGGVVTMAEAFSVQMTEDANLRTAPFTLPQWFGEATDMPEWVPFLPQPHNFDHPSYGTVSITPQRIDNFVTQFNAGVYQDQIPLDGEHRTKESGALAWVKELRTNEDGSADARVTWTPRGEQMYRDGAFKYISPEWYDEWSDPATGKAYKDVAIGGALTTRPFFKAPYLRPLAASENAEGDIRLQPTAGERSHGMTATTDTVSPAQFSELQQQFAEMQGTVRTLTEERDTFKSMAETAEAEKTALADRVGGLEKDARTKRYGETVRDWPGDPGKNVARLVKFSEVYGEESDDFKEFVAEQNGLAAQLKDSGIFREVGSTQGGTGIGAAAKLDALAKKMSEEKSITYHEAYDAVLKNNPELYTEYNAEMRG